MSKPLTPREVIEKAKKGAISKSDAAETLISLIEGSDDSEIRAESIIGLDQIAYKTEQIFKIVENILISDNNPFVRNAAAQVITHHYVKEGLNSLKYAITHENSPIVMKTISDFLKNFKGQPLEYLNGEFNKWLKNFASDIGIVPEEAKFFLDLEALFANGNENYEIDTDTYEYYKILNDFKSGKPWLVLKDDHVEVLNLNFFNWRFLKENRDNIESINRLSSPDLFLRSIRNLNFNYNDSLKIPESIGLLKSLKILNLSRNKITDIPNSIGLLPLIEKLDLSRNNIIEISDSICALTSLKILDLSHNNIQTIPSCIKNLQLLNELRIHKNKIKKVPDSLKSFFNSLEVFKI